MLEPFPGLKLKKSSAVMPDVVIVFKFLCR